MTLDIRLPVGLLFSILGALLVVYGALSDASVYQRSLGININLWWGFAMFAFGVLMLVLSRKSMKGR